MSDNAGLFDLMSAVYELTQDNGMHIICPSLETNDKTRQLVHEWASSLARISGHDTTIYRNGAKQITLPGKK